MFEELKTKLIRLIGKGIYYIPELQSGSGEDWPPNPRGRSHQVDDTIGRESLDH